MAKRKSILSEFILFIKHNKAYWMIPILVVILLCILLVSFGSTAATPFIYILF